MGANFVQVLTTCDKRSTDHSLTYRIHCTLTFMK